MMSLLILKEFQNVDENDEEAVEAFKEENFLTDEDIENMQAIEVLEERKVQDYRSTYNDIRDWIRRKTRQRSRGVHYRLGRCCF